MGLPSKPPDESDVFVAYNSADKPAVRELALALHNRGVRVWFDEWSAVPGRPFLDALAQAIDAARAAVVVIGAHGLGGWQRGEVRAAIARLLDRALPVIPVLLPDAPDPKQLPLMLDQLHVVDMRGGVTADGVDRLQRGIRGEPTGPPRATPHRPPAADTPIPRPPALIQPARPGHVHALTALLERTRDGVQVRYQHGAGAATKPIAAPWAEHRATLENAATTLDRGDPIEVAALLDTARDGLGGALFALLFGPGEQWRSILSVLAPVFDTVGPIAEPVHVRVATSDPLLAGLPWRLATWRGYLLIDNSWRFALATVHETSTHDMTVPCPVLIVAPRAHHSRHDAPDPDHPRAIAQTLAAAWPTGGAQNYLHTASTRAQLVKRLRARPAFVYVHAATARHNGRLCLLLDADSDADARGTKTPPSADPLPIHALPRLFDDAGHTPDLVYLDVAGAPVDEPPRLGVRATLWRRLPRRTPESAALSLAWLESWLDDGRDPIDALHRAAATRDPLACAEAATVVAHAAYRRWTTPRFARTRPKDDPLRLLDRDAPKAMIAKHVRELAQSPKQRVLAVIAYAEASNRVDDLWSQLREYLDDLGERDVAIEWIKLQFPELRDQLDVDLEHELREQLDAAPGETIEQLLCHHAPEAVADARPVIWLNWGVFGDPGRRPADAPPVQPALKPSQLRQWLQWTATFVAACCPDYLRVVSYVAIEAKDADKVKNQLGKLHKQPWARKPGFRLDALHAEHVEEKHLLDYLRDYSSCDPEIQLEVAERLYADTGGDFARTVARLEPMGPGKWYSLRDALRKQQGEDPDDDDDDDEL